MSYTGDFETHINLSHKKSVLFYGRIPILKDYPVYGTLFMLHP